MMLFSLSHLPYWIVLAIGVLLFLLVIFAGGGDADGDMDIDADAEAGFSLGQAVGWLGFGKAPLLLLLATDFSLLGVVGWMLNVLAGSPTGFGAGLVLGVALAVALAGGSLVSRPLSKIFAQFGEDASGDRLIGCVGTVSSALIPALGDRRIGQVDVFDTARNRVTIATARPDWSTICPRRGEQVLVIDRQPDYYLVIAKDSPDQDTWFSNIREARPS
jgi:hypothetical protein